MKNIVYILIATLCLSCMRRPMVDELCQDSSADELIAVKVDWSQSRITPSEDSNSGDYVHRVSIRFFPTDGSAVFDRYLEGDIYQGSIDVPDGEYDVVVFNESIYDPYWSGVFEFLNVDDYDEFIAELVDEDAEYSTEAYKLASWSIEGYTVSQQTRSSSELENVVLQPLTCYVNVSAEVENLASAQSVYCEVQGFSNRVYMASGESHVDQTLHTMELITREYSDDENQHGAISHERLILTRSTDQESNLKLIFEVYLTDGTLHQADTPLEFDVESQATRYATDDYDLSVQFSLPEVSGGIDVGGWETGGVVTIF